MARIVRGPARGAARAAREPAGVAALQAVAAVSPEKEKTTPAKVLLQYLELEGATTVFGVPGGAIKDLLFELVLQDQTFRHVVCRHETGAAYMADGWTRAGGGLGVVAVTTGPGATNALTGVVNAQASGSPVLTITGEVAEEFFGRGYLQEGFDAGLDVHAIYAAASEYSAVVTSPENCSVLFEQALRDARSLPHRAAHLSLPDDVARGPLDVFPFPKHPSAYRTTTSCSDPALARRTLELLLGAEWPVLLLGNGCRGALRDPAVNGALHRLVDKFALPVMTTPDAKGVFPESHPLSLRNYGKAACRWTVRYLDGWGGRGPHDALCVIGSSLGDWATCQWHPRLAPEGTPIVQVDLDPSVLGRSWPLEFGVVAEIGRFLVDLAAAGETEPRPEAADRREARVARLKAEVQPAPEPEQNGPAGRGLDPRVVMTTLERHLRSGLPRPAHVFVDSGNCVGWSLGYMTVDPPVELHSSLAMGPMGFAVGAVVGAKLAQPDATCVAIAGDGAFMMHGTEVSTAKREGIAPVWIVLDDDDLGMVSQGMAKAFGQVDPPVDFGDRYTLGGPDLVRFAEAFHADATRVERATDLDHAIERALKGAQGDTPQVVVVAVDRSFIPPYFLPEDQLPKE